MSEAWQNTDGQQANRGYNGGNPSFGSRNFNNSNFNRGPRRDGAINGGGYQGSFLFLILSFHFILHLRNFATFCSIYDSMLFQMSE